MIGREVGNYRIVSLIGEGGMGQVYMAEHPTIDRKVAVKVLRADLAANTSVVSRFVTEARVASTLRHPNVIEVFDTGQLAPDHVPYMLMEMLEGESLADRITRLGRIDQNDALEWTYQTAAALGAAHAKNIVHRDLKPANLFLVPDDRIPDREKIKVLDFGIAKVLGGLSGSGALQQTQTGMLMGTPLYMSPEQCRGAKEIDTRSDIYSLGLIMYEMLCGAPPFVSEGFAELISMHLMRPPAPPRTHNPAIGEEVEQVILRALAKEPDNRFATVQDLQRALGYEPSRPTGSGRVSAGLAAAQRRASGPMPTLAAAPSIIAAMPPPAARDEPAMPRRTPLPPTRPTPEATRMPTPARTPTAGVPVTPGRPGTVASNPSLVAYQPGSTPAHGSATAAAAVTARSGGNTKAIVAVLALIGAGAAAGVVVAQRKSAAPPRTALDEAWDLSHRADSYSFPSNDYAHACPLWEQSCDRENNDYGCLRAGLCYEQALGGVKKDRDRSCGFYAKGCSSSSSSREGYSCDNLVECYDASLQDASAQKLFCDVSESRCDKGSSPACAGAGVCAAHATGGRARNPARGCDLWQKACDGGLADGCGWLGGCYANSDGGRDHDPAHALALFKKACEHGTRMVRDGCVAADQVRKDQAAPRKRHADVVAQETRNDTRGETKDPVKRETLQRAGAGAERAPHARPVATPKPVEDDDIPVR